MNDLWILNHYAALPSEATGTRHFDLAQELRTHGWNTTIFAASATHLCPPRPLPYGLAWHEEVNEGVRFVWIRTMPCGQSRLKRLANELLYTLAVPWAAAPRPKPAVVMGSSAHLFAGLAAQRLARRLGAKFVFEIRDLWPETLVQLGRLSRSHPLVRLLARLETWLYASADHLVTLLPGAADYIAHHGGAGRPLTVLPNGVCLNRPQQPVPEPVAARLRDLRRGSQFLLAYAGAHGQANALEPLLEAVALLNDTGIGSVSVVLIGDGREKPALEQQARRLRLHNVYFLPAVPKAALQSALSVADAFYLGWRDSPLYQYGISPNKLGDYLAAGRPVVHATNCRFDPVAAGQCGLTVPAEDSEALAEAILKMTRMPRGERDALGANARRFAEEELSMAALARRLAAEVLSV